MSDILLILLIIAVVKSIFFAVILFVVFRRDIQQWWSGKKAEKKPLSAPICMYCQSKWTRALDEGQTRWDNEDLVLVTTYECQHCHLPFWHVERVSTSSVKR